jgi:putative minor structural protein|nr:MAG TPA: major capsid protein [Caudoviricetes sp.]
MKLIDQLETIDNQLKDLGDKISNAEDKETIEGLMAEVKELKNAKAQLIIQTEEETVEKQVSKNYLETEQALHDFVKIQMTSHGESEIKNAWEAKLVENGVTITDKDNYLPKKLELDIQTVLTRSNPVYPIFKHTNVGAILVARDFTSDDEAKVHVPGTTKSRQTATLKVSGLKPRMVYKATSINEIDKRTIDNFAELYQLLVAELAQRVIDKVVDLALVEGSATDGDTGEAQNENGFISVMNETNVNKVKKINGKADLVAAVEQAVDGIDAPGKKYLVVTKAQKRDILDALRKKFPQSTFLNNNRDIANVFGVDELVIYQGTKELMPIVIAQDAYHVDMQPLNRIEQFRLDTNENDILVETPATGRPVAFGGAVVIDTTK